MIKKERVTLHVSTPPQSYRMSPVISDHTVLPATLHKWMHLS